MIYTIQMNGIKEVGVLFLKYNISNFIRLIMKNDNLKRVKGILSAKQGTEVPKYSGGAKFKLPYQGSTLYSIDKESWFTDEACSNPFIMTETDEFRSALDYAQPIPQKQTLDMKIPGSVTLDPNTAVEQASQQLNKEQQAEQDLKAQSAAFKQANGISLLTPDPLPRSLNDTEKDKLQSVVEEKVSAGMKLQQEKQEKQTKQVQQTGQIMSSSINALGSAFKANNQVSNSNTTNMIDAGTQAVSSTLSGMGGIAGAVGQVIGMTDSVGQIIRGITGGTDQMTATDKFFDSGIISLNILL